MKKILPFLFFLVAILSTRAQLTAEIITSDVLCFGDSDGSIEIFATGGSGSYTYAVVASGTTVSSSDYISSSVFSVPIGNYDVYVRDGILEYQFNDVVINPPQEINFVTVVSEPISCSQETATILLEITDGIPPFTIEVSDPVVGVQITENNHTNSSVVVAGLYAGQYLITVSDANGCSAIQDIVLAPSLELDVTVSTISNASCDGLSGAEIQVYAVGGTPPYEYSIDGGITWSVNSIFSDLTQGSEHDIIVKDIDNCYQAYGAYTVPFSDTLVSASVIISSNEIEVTATGGTTPYTFSLIDPSGTTVVAPVTVFAGNANFTFTDLDVGEYQTLVSDANGCTFISNILVIDLVEVPVVSDDTLFVNSNESAVLSILDNDSSIPPSATILTSDPQNGSISIHDAGTPNDITDDTILYTPNTNFFGEDSFEYTICSDVTSDEYCDTATVSINVEGEQSLEFTTLFENVTCSGASNGNISVNLAEGIGGPYRYRLIELIEPGTGISTILADVTVDEPTYLFEGLTAAYYEIQVIVPNLTYGTEIITIEETTPVVSNTSVTENSVSIETTGGLPPYEYSIDGGTTYQTSSIFNDLIEGTYEVITRDANDCIVTNTITLSSVLEPISFEPIITQFSCVTGNITNPASVFVNENSILGGNGNFDRVIFTYTPSEGVIEIQDSSSFNFFTSNTSGGEVEVIVYDSSGSFAVANSFINPFNELINLDFVIDKELDAISGADITCLVQTSLQESDLFTYTLSKYGDFILSNDTGVFTNLSSGLYMVSVTNNLTGCIITNNLQISDLPEYFLSLELSNTLICFGEATGEIAFTIHSLGTPYTGTYDYELFYNYTPIISASGVTGESVLTALESGEYYIVATMTESPFMTLTSSVFRIEEAGLPLVSSTIVTNPSCFSSFDGSILVTANGGFGGYEYQLYNTHDGVVIHSFSSSNIFENLSAGNYTVAIRDIGGCMNYESVTVEEVEQLAFDVTITNPSCLVSNSGEIIVEGFGGTPPYEFSIDVNANEFQTSPIFTGLSSGSYEVTILDDNGCTFTMQAIIEETTPVTIDSIVALPSGNEASGNIVVGATGGNGNYSFSIDEVNFSFSNSFFDLQAGIYNIIASDSNECTSAPFEVTIVSLDIDNSVSEDLLGVLTASFEDAISYQWINVDTGERIPGATEAFFTPSENGRYQVEMTIANATTISGKGIQSVSVNQTVLSPVIVYESAVLSTTDFENILKVYPNPASNFINIPDYFINQNYSIYTILGEEVKSGKIEDTSLEIYNLSNGIYYLKVPSYNVVKFIKE